MKTAVVLSLVFFFSATSFALEEPSTSAAARGSNQASASGSSGPCSCSGNVCKCCANLQMKGLPRSAQGAGNMNPCFTFTFKGDTMSVNVVGTMGGKKLFEREISGQNPPPVCFSPPQAPVVQMCVRFHDLSMVNHSLQVCSDLEGGLTGQPPITKVPMGCVVADRSGKAKYQKSPRSTEDTQTEDEEKAE